MTIAPALGLCNRLISFDCSCFHFAIIGLQLLAGLVYSGHVVTVVGLQVCPANERAGERMDRVEFTIPEVMEICNVGRRMVMSWMDPKDGEEQKLPDWHYRLGEPKYGRLIPAKNIRALLEKEDPMRLERLNKAVEEKAKSLGIAS
jgi:hypothetical protein